jgi:dipeptidyl-peptidase-4
MQRWTVVLIWCWFTSLALLGAQEKEIIVRDKMLTIDDLYDPESKRDFNGSVPSDLTWLQDGRHYLEHRKSEISPLWKVDAATGDGKEMFAVTPVKAALAKLLDISPEKAQRALEHGILQLSQDERVMLLDASDDLVAVELASAKLSRITATPEKEELAEISPDGRHVSFVRNNNLYVTEISSQRERTLTSDGSAHILNGRLDWLYQEELYGRGNFKGYWWSPDGSRIAYLRLDDTEVPKFTIVDHLPRLQAVETMPYTKSGDKNPKVSLGVVDVESGKTRWVDLSAYNPGDLLIARVGWIPNGTKVVYQVQNREQTWLDLNESNPKSGKNQTLLRDRTPAWIEAADNPYWLPDGSFLWLSERSGWQHIYYYTQQGKLIRQVTDGKWEVRKLHGFAAGFIYFSATAHSHIAEHVYRIRLDGSKLKRLSLKEGNHAAIFSPDFSFYLDYWSDVHTPVQLWLQRATGEVVRAVAENPVLALQEYKMGQVEFVQVNTRDDFVMECMMIRPPDFQATKKYPVLCYTYGGPHSPIVRNAWGKMNYLWHQMWAQQGYIVWLCDNRTASGKGAESAWPAYRRLGKLELEDWEDSLTWLKVQPYVDGSRIGLWGWSYGGFMTSYALTHSKSFRLGIAIGSVTDWALYDSIYTEKYMSLPQKNPEGYKQSSVVAAAQDLHGKLLLIHGMLDDNVHMQNTIQLVYALQQAGKSFDLLLYPASQHGITEAKLVKHMRQAMSDFIRKNL